MTELKQAGASEQSLIAFDPLAEVAIIASPPLFRAIEPVPQAASPRALIALGVIVALLTRPLSSQDVVAVLIISTGIAWLWFRRQGAAA